MSRSVNGVAFGMARDERPRRHIRLADDSPAVRPAEEPGQRPTPEEAAAAAYARLSGFLGEIPIDQDTETLSVKYELESLGVCGDHGRKVTYRGRCPKCAGPVMTLSEIAAHRKRLEERRAKERG